MDTNGKLLKFRTILIQGTCNLKCDYCGGTSIKIDQVETIGKLSKVFNRFNKDEYAIRVECFGEITLYPEIINYLEEKADHGYRIEILSNGIRALEVLKEDTKLHCIFSLDGQTREMNIARNLTQEQVDKILKAIFKFNAEINCVYYKQSIEDINKYILYLKDNNYNGLLNIFPCRFGKEHQVSYLKYEDLIRTDFLPPKEYFDNWKHLILNGAKDRNCDLINNGYLYSINTKDVTSSDITMLKCNGSPTYWKYIHEYGEELENKPFKCGTCINYYFYNNSRKFMNCNY